MAGRTPYGAWASYVVPLRQALRCITPGRFVLRASQRVRVDTEYSVVLNNMNSAPLQGANEMFLIFGQTVRIKDWQPAFAGERYQVQTISYVYGFTIETGQGEQELLAFHWNQDQSPSSMIPHGHLHIGKVLLARPTPFRPGDFQNAHVPTGFVDFADVVRFAIVELGVAPLTDNWQAILDARQNAP